MFKRYILLMLMALPLSACTTDNQALQVPLYAAASKNQLAMASSKLDLHIIKKLPGADGFGGNVGNSKIYFKNVLSWMRQSFSNLETLKCLKKPASITLTLTKLYAGINSSVLIGNMQVKAIYNNEGKQQNHYYGANCVTSFFAVSSQSALQQCFNQNIQKIKKQIIRTLCEQG